MSGGKCKDRSGSYKMPGKDVRPVGAAKPGSKSRPSNDRTKPASVDLSYKAVKGMSGKYPTAAK